MAGIALLGALPQQEADVLVHANSTHLSKFCRMTESEVRRLVSEAHLNGYSTSVNAVIDGVAAVGMAVPSNYERPYLAISVSAIAARIPQERIPVLVTLLEKYTDKIAKVTGSAKSSH
jgi:DNA-binding IclR family transcriptional regulator